MNFQFTIRPAEPSNLWYVSSYEWAMQSITYIWLWGSFMGGDVSRNRMHWNTSQDRLVDKIASVFHHDLDHLSSGCSRPQKTHENFKKVVVYRIKRYIYFGVKHVGMDVSGEQFFKKLYKNSWISTFFVSKYCWLLDLTFHQLLGELFLISISVGRTAFLNKPSLPRS